MMHVYQIPEMRSNGYCFGGGVPITFLNVDWMGDPPNSMTADEVKAFLMRKQYVTMAGEGTRFLVLCDARPELTFQFSKESEE